MDVTNWLLCCILCRKSYLILQIVSLRSRVPRNWLVAYEDYYNAYT